MAPTPKAMTTVAERFNSKLVLDPSGCWLWTAYIRANGYGEIRFNGRAERAHRVSWLLHRGDIPVGLCVLHKCDVRACVNPDHLFLGTRADNNSDAASKNRMPFGEQHWNSKLTIKQIREIRNAVGTQREIAEQFGIGQMQVSRIKNNAQWRHI